MNIKIISSGSVGNSLILTSSKGQNLIIDAGVKFNRIQKALKFNYRGVVAVLVGHSHLDHCKAVKDICKNGMDVYCLKETSDCFGFESHRIKNILPEKTFQVGEFKILPFELKHDVPCLGFLIDHEESGKFIYVTDSFYLPVKFSGLRNILIEANYCPEIVARREANGELHSRLRDRVLQSHLSIDTCLGALKANDLSLVNNIILLHLSDANSDSEVFIEKVKNQTGKMNVFVAKPGLELEFNKTPF